MARLYPRNTTLVITGHTTNTGTPEKLWLILSVSDNLSKFRYTCLPKNFDIVYSSYTQVIRSRFFNFLSRNLIKTANISSCGQYEEFITYGRRLTLDLFKRKVRIKSHSNYTWLLGPIYRQSRFTLLGKF